ncbi:hypothetical protein [Streptomyces sp. NBRC 109706]|uniref:hypothetical protein n=1 Tax=Streptomyces sp. NBRC 109706 TaxID=1550035 RepID=UPI000A77F624|nr:hypothetical protein [Streptomyces sp. NBRC 109706]
MSAAPPDDTRAPLPSPLEAVPELRAAARWLIAAFGAVGAALIGGGPLVAVSRIDGARDALIAGAALLVALTGVTVAIWHISRVLVPPITTTATLADPALRPLRELIDAAPADFLGSAAESVADLLRHRAIAANIHRALLAEADPRRREQLDHHLLRARANIARTDPHIRWLLAMAHVWQIRATFHAARRWCLLSVALVAAGAVAFLTVAGQPA